MIPPRARLLLTALVVAGCAYEFTRLDDVAPGTVVGRTVDAGDAAVISFARIGVDGAPRIVRSRADGGFVIARLTAGTWLLHLTSDLDGDTVAERSAIRAVAIRQIGEDLSSVLLGDVALDGTATLTGRVVDTDGAPVAGARVVVYRNAGELEPEQNAGVQSNVDLGAEQQTATSAEGVYRLAGVTRGNVRLAAISADGGVVSATVGVRAAPGPDIVVSDLVLDAAGVRPAQVEVLNPPSDEGSALRIDIVRHGGARADPLLTHQTPAAPIVGGLNVPTGLVDVYVTDLDAEGNERRSGVLLGRVVVPGSAPLEWGQVELGDGDPCGGTVNRDRDSLGALPNPATNLDLWIACAPQCLGALGDEKSVVGCRVDGAVYDCDDDDDGQPDVTEPFECVSLCRGTDLDGDGLCSSVDPFPHCRENDAASCADEPPFPEPASRYGGALAVVAGEGQEGPVGAALAQPIVVAAVDADGRPVAGIAVALAVTEGGGALSATSLVTDVDGRAATIWTLGTRAGANRLTVSAPGRAPAELEATGRAGPPATVEVVAGDEQQGVAGVALAAPLVVSVVDAHANPAGGVVVDFTVVEGGGLLAAPSAITDAEGRASMAWTLGTGAGANAAEASTPGAAPASFTATGLAGPPVELLALAGDGQSGIAGETLFAPITVAVVDEHGNGVLGLEVELAISGGGGALSSSSILTDALGRAATAWTLGRQAGPNTAEATVAGLATLVFTATGLPGPAAELLAVSGDGQEGPAGTTLPEPFVVAVVDGNGNPVAGALVDFAVTSGGGALSATSVTSDASGHALTTLTLGRETGLHTVEAGTAGAPPLVFQATATSPLCQTGCDCPTAQGCVGGVCGACVANGDCCAPFVCISGSCQLVLPP
jgi:5-hydroxyisourate hydrolase-like protein (transthyretin family)